MRAVTEGVTPILKALSTSVASVWRRRYFLFEETKDSLKEEIKKIWPIHDAGREGTL